MTEETSIVIRNTVVAPIETWCCCDYSTTLAVAKAISDTAAYMRTTCSADVDCVDYSKATSADIHDQAEGECAAYQTYLPVLNSKLADIEKKIKKGCK